MGKSGQTQATQAHNARPIFSSASDQSRLENIRKTCDIRRGSNAYRVEDKRRDQPATYSLARLHFSLLGALTTYCCYFSPRRRDLVSVFPPPRGLAHKIFE